MSAWYEKWKRDNPDRAEEMRGRFDDLLRDTFDADFNETDDNNRVAVLLPDGQPVPELGRIIHLYDADGNYCGGVVREVSDHLMYVECDWDTWWCGQPVPFNECPDRAKHRYPEGPNEDTGICRLCHAHTWELRPETETYGDHLPDCSLPRRHESYCQPGGAGHPRAPMIRGYFGPRIDEDTDLVAVTAEGSVEIKGYWAR